MASHQVLINAQLFHSFLKIKFPDPVFNNKFLRSQQFLIVHKNFAAFLEQISILNIFSKIKLQKSTTVPQKIINFNNYLT